MSTQRTAAEIIEMLREKHEKDVFVAECKTGPTWWGAPIRLDAWAMRRSWAKPAFVGYEVKVSRQDFVNDEKWRMYLDYCSDFYFVSPPDVIRPNELPDDVGLIWTSKTGSRLFTKRKAPHRDVTPPADLLIYILMSRSRIDDMCHLTYGSRHASAAYWRAWLDQKREDRELGRRVGNALREHVEDVEKQCRKLRNENEALESIRQLVIELGHDPDVPVNRWHLRTVRDRLTEAMPSGLLNDIRHTERNISELRARLEQEVRA